MRCIATVYASHFAHSQPTHAHIAHVSRVLDPRDAHNMGRAALRAPAVDRRAGRRAARDACRARVRHRHVHHDALHERHRLKRRAAQRCALPHPTSVLIQL